MSARGQRKRSDDGDRSSGHGMVLFSPGPSVVRGGLRDADTARAREAESQRLRVLQGQRQGAEERRRIVAEPPRLSSVPAIEPAGTFGSMMRRPWGDEGKDYAARQQLYYKKQGMMAEQPVPRLSQWPDNNDV